MIERSRPFAILRREMREGRLRVNGEEDRVQRCEGNERGERRYKLIRRLTSFDRLICDRENLVFDSLIYLEPVERFKNRSTSRLKCNEI